MWSHRTCEKWWVDFAVILVLLVLCAACAKPEAISAEVLSDFVWNHDGLNQANEVNEYSVRVVYRPTDLVVHQELSTGTFDSAKVSELRTRYGDYYYFVVSFSHDDGEVLNGDYGVASFRRLVETLAFRMSEYAVLVTSDRQTIALGDFMLDRTYGLSSSSNMLLVFDREKAAAADWVELVIQDVGLQTGTLRFRFLKEHLDNTPQIDVWDLIAVKEGEKESIDV